MEVIIAALVVAVIVAWDWIATQDARKHCRDRPGGHSRVKYPDGWRCDNCGSHPGDKWWWE
jgi:hypothetical protein